MKININNFSCFVIDYHLFLKFPSYVQKVQTTFLSNDYNWSSQDIKKWKVEEGTIMFVELLVCHLNLKNIVYYYLDWKLKKNRTTINYKMALFKTPLR